jgi:hypothetical protein
VKPKQKRLLLFHLSALFSQDRGCQKTNLPEQFEELKRINIAMKDCRSVVQGLGGGFINEIDLIPIKKILSH